MILKDKRQHQLKNPLHLPINDHKRSTTVHDPGCFFFLKKLYVKFKRRFIYGHGHGHDHANANGNKSTSLPPPTKVRRPSSLPSTAAILTRSSSLPTLFSSLPTAATSPPPPLPPIAAGLTTIELELKLGYKGHWYSDSFTANDGNGMETKWCVGISNSHLLSLFNGNGRAFVVNINYNLICRLYAMENVSIPFGGYSSIELMFIDEFNEETGDLNEIIKVKMEITVQEKK